MFFFEANKQPWTLYSCAGRVEGEGRTHVGRHGQTRKRCNFFASGTRERHGRHGHETMQPLVNHLMSTSGFSRRYSSRDLCRTNQLLFSCSIQCTTRRKRSSGDTTGKSLAFSVSSMGRACSHVDQRSFMPHASLRQEEHLPWPSSS